MRASAQRQKLRVRVARSARALRFARDWTQEQAAEAAGRNPRHYRKIEEGSINATLETIERLCRAFGVDVLELFHNR
jgi:XRE family transcriptional regulator, regulator of sulfur utilization